MLVRLLQTGIAKSSFIVGPCMFALPVLTELADRLLLATVALASPSRGAIADLAKPPARVPSPSFPPLACREIAICLRLATLSTALSQLGTVPA